jgi:transposase
VTFAAPFYKIAGTEGAPARDQVEKAGSRGPYELEGDFFVAVGVRATRILRISWDEAWHILERAVERGQRATRPRVTPQLGADEKAIAKGHLDPTLVCDLDRSTVEFIAEDRKQANLAAYFTGLTADQLTGIAAIALDMWEPYIQAIRAHVPDAETKIVFDRYHIMTHMGTAVDVGLARY